MGEIDQFYQMLHLSPGASLAEVKQARRDLVKVWHPDRFPNNARIQQKGDEQLKLINHAYEILERYLTISRSVALVDYSAQSYPSRSQSNIINGLGYPKAGPSSFSGCQALYDMVLIPAGSFTMGDTFRVALGARQMLSDIDEYSSELQMHEVHVGGLFMDRCEVTLDLWTEVRDWAEKHGYQFDNPGAGKASNHPVHSVSWDDAVKWCNARSEKEGLVPSYYTDETGQYVYRRGQLHLQSDGVRWLGGYRLPTEAEWEKAARGGRSGQMFPWGIAISQKRANYNSVWRSQSTWINEPKYDYDHNSTPGYHPQYQSGGGSYTSPVGSFSPNGYGLYDMAGNVNEWCWDWYGCYSGDAQVDPRGPATGSYRVVRGGSWYDDAEHLRCASRGYFGPQYRNGNIGFRCVIGQA